MGSNIRFKKTCCLLLASLMVGNGFPLPARAVLDNSDHGPVLECGSFSMRVTNAGIVGNAFFDVGLSSDPSFEFPSHSGVELLNYAALWVGARTERDGNRVSGGPLLEWRPTIDPEDRVRTTWNGQLGNGYHVDDDGDGRVDEESLNGRDDDGDGEIDEDLGLIGQQMLTADYTDDGPASLSNVAEGESPRPLHLSVHQEVYGWSMPGYENIAGLRFHITNHGRETLRDLHLGVLADLDVRRRNDRSGHLNDVPYDATFFSREHDDCFWRFERPVTVLSEGISGESRVTTGPQGSGMRHASPVPEEAAGTDVLALDGAVDRSDVYPGERLTYRFVLNNLIYYPVGWSICLESGITPGLTYVPGSARLDGRVTPDPEIDGRALMFSFFGMPARGDVNGDGLIQPCEPGHRTLTYQVKVEPQAGFGEYFNSAVACTGTVVKKPASGRVVARVSVVKKQSSMPLITLVPLDRTTDPLQRIRAGVPFKTTLFDRNGLPGQGGLPHTDADRYAAMAGTFRGSPGETPDDYVVLVSQGPFASLAPGESIDFDAALVAADDAEGLFDAVSRAEDIHPSSWLDPGSVPPPPNLRVVPLDHAVRVEWDNRPEVLIAGRQSGPEGTEFAGYNVYKLADWRGRQSLLPPRQNWSLLASVGPESDFGQIPLGAVTDSSVEYDRILFERPLYPPGRYRMTDSLVQDGFDYVYAVSTISDVRSPGGTLVARLESPLPVRFFDRVTPQAASQEKSGGVWVVPNPFRANAHWDRPPVLGDPLTRHIDFMGLPRAQSTIKIWTVAGDLVAVIDHDGSQGDGEAEWNLVSRNGQDVESGLYLFTVDSSFGHQVGRFVVIR